MKPTEDQLNRLFRAASRAPKGGTDAALFTLEARVIGNWRAGAPAELGEDLLAWLRRAAIGACLLALVSLAWNHHELEQASTHGDELAAVDTGMRSGIEP